MLHDMVARAWIQTLNLRPHPQGGWYVETWRVAEGRNGEVLADGTDPEDAALEERRREVRRLADRRARGAAIYYLLAEGAVGVMHRIASDEVWHHYAGDSAEMLQLREDGSVLRTLLGPDVAHGERPQVVVPRGTWLGVRIVPRGRRSLLGCTVAPGSDFATFDLANRTDLIQRWPDLEDEIRRLIPDEPAGRTG